MHIKNYTMKVLVLVFLVAAACAAPNGDTVWDSAPDGDSVWDSAQDDDNVWNFEMEDIEKISEFIETKEDLIEFLTEGNEAEKVELTGFQFKDCGAANSATAITSVTLTPDPISFPGSITVGANFEIKRNFGMPLSASLVIEKKVLGKYIKIPCIDNFGSCTYDGLCGDLEQVTCPVPIVKIGIDCRCPFKAKSYMFPATSFDVDVSLPLPTGDYHINANVMSNGTQAACLDLIFTLK